MKLYYFSIPLFLINLYFLIVGFFMMPFAIGYESTPRLIVILYITFLLCLLVTSILFSKSTIKLLANKDVSEKIIFRNFIMLSVTSLIIIMAYIFNM